MRRNPSRAPGPERNPSYVHIASGPVAQFNPHARPTILGGLRSTLRAGSARLTRPYAGRRAGPLALLGPSEGRPDGRSTTVGTGASLQCSHGRRRPAAPRGSARTASPPARRGRAPHGPTGRPARLAAARASHLTPAAGRPADTGQGPGSSGRPSSGDRHREDPAPGLTADRSGRASARQGHPPLRARCPSRHQPVRPAAGLRPVSRSARPVTASPPP